MKYAGIPQSAIPQEASVLALRSSMSDMDWLLDGEDGSTAQPGDIVIYNKYVTRTVAVDSSADGVDPDLDDLFSVDTKPADSVDSSSSVDAEPTDTVDDSFSVDAEFENSAELAEYDVSAPDIIPSTAYSAPGTETFTPSVVSPATEPQTTTVTDALPVETVGIVSEVDSDAGTLTVISGDVDGKVAEVALYDADVLAVVDVAAAQYASQLPTISPSCPNRVPALAAGTTYLDYFVETSEGTNKGGITDITVMQGTKVLNPGDQIELNDGDKLSLNYTFNIPEDALKDLTTKTLTYQLPAGIELSENKSFPLVDQSTNLEVGTGVVDTDGVVQLTFNEEFDTSKLFTGHFDFEAEASTVGTQESNTIRFPTGLELIVTLPRDLAIEKKGSAPVVDSDGTTCIDYTVIVSSMDGWSQPIEILDELQNTETIAGEYVTDSFKLVKIDASNSESEVTDYNNFFSADSFHITELKKLDSGESYRLTYRVKITKNTATDAGHSEFQNRARSNNENDWKRWTTKFEDRISVSGSQFTPTNKETESSGYVLPSTGGTGTLPFTAVGGTMMLTALAYSFIHHKRRREGRADD